MKQDYNDIILVVIKVKYGFGITFRMLLEWMFIISITPTITHYTLEVLNWISDYNNKELIGNSY